MKKFITCLMILLFFTLSAFSNTTHTTNIVDFMAYINVNYEYKSDIDNFNANEYWQEPIELIINRSGDCEDFALYIAIRLRTFGYAVTTYGVISANGGHVLNVVRDNTGKVYITSNNEFISFTNATLVTDIQLIETYYYLLHDPLTAIGLIRPDPIYGVQTINTYNYNIFLIKEYK